MNESRTPPSGSARPNTGVAHHARVWSAGQARDIERRIMAAAPESWNANATPPNTARGAAGIARESLDERAASGSNRVVPQYGAVALKP
ncbi:hypothetical protein ACIF9R_29615 [Streptomyces sp. NPDC086080]|uniref:hypothetical protein n=1 Tax=Streptomyces sp. NPDC086080 TaxID=3365748 RepID=UPI0037D2B1E3